MRLRGYGIAMAANDINRLNQTAGHEREWRYLIPDKLRACQGAHNAATLSQRQAAPL